MDKNDVRWELEKLTRIQPEVKEMIVKQYAYTWSYSSPANGQNQLSLERNCNSELYTLNFIIVESIGENTINEELIKPY